MRRRRASLDNARGIINHSRTNRNGNSTGSKHTTKHKLKTLKKRQPQGLGCEDEVKGPHSPSTAPSTQ